MKWLKRLFQRRIIHEEPECYKCQTDNLDVMLRWYKERVGRFTIEEGYLCEACAPKEPEQKIVFKATETGGKPTKTFEQRKTEWIETMRKVEAGEEVEL
jgi:hypothetical protein